jgi:hypothetical protein
MKFRLFLSIALFLSAAAAFGQGPTYPYTVTATWTISTTSTVTGQNFYRAPYAAGACGAYAKLNSAPLSATATTAIDATVIPGGAYCYAVTAIAPAPAGESGFSNVVQNIQIPPAPPTGLSATVQ